MSSSDVAAFADQMRDEMDALEDEERREKELAAEPFTGAVLLCPVCSSQADAEKWGTNEIDCLTCETSFTVNLIPEIVQRYSIV